MPGSRDHDPVSRTWRLLAAMPFLSAGAALLMALAIGSDLSEAVFAGSMSGACPAFALAAVAASRRRDGERRRAHLAAASLASVLLLGCYVYGRLAGYPTTDIRVGLSVVLFAIMLAGLASAAIDLRRVAAHGDASRHGPTTP